MVKYYFNRARDLYYQETFKNDINKVCNDKLQIFIIKTAGQESRKMFGLEFLSIYEAGSCLCFVIRIISARHQFYTRPRIFFERNISFVEYLVCTEIDRIEYDVQIQSVSVNR